MRVTTAAVCWTYRAGLLVIDVENFAKDFFIHSWRVLMLQGILGGGVNPKASQLKHDSPGNVVWPKQRWLRCIRWLGCTSIRHFTGKSAANIPIEWIPLLSRGNAEETEEVLMFEILKCCCYDITSGPRSHFGVPCGLARQCR